MPGHIRCSVTWQKSSKLFEQPNGTGDKSSWRYEKGPSWKIGDRRKIGILIDIDSMGLVERYWTMGGDADIDTVKKFVRPLVEERQVKGLKFFKSGGCKVKNGGWRYVIF